MKLATIIAQIAWYTIITPLIFTLKLATTAAIIISPIAIPEYLISLISH